MRNNNHKTEFYIEGREALHLEGTDLVSQETCNLFREDETFCEVGFRYRWLLGGNAVESDSGGGDPCAGREACGGDPCAGREACGGDHCAGKEACGGDHDGNRRSFFIENTDLYSECLGEIPANDATVEELLAARTQTLSKLAVRC